MVLHVKIPSYWTAQWEEWAFTKWDSLNMNALEWMCTSVQSENVWRHVGVWPWLHRDLFRKEGLDNLNTGTLCSFHLQWKKKWRNKDNPEQHYDVQPSPSCLLVLIFSVSVLSCLIFWPLPAVCACATFGTSPPTGTCARPGNPNQDALLGSVQLTRLGNCTLTLIFMAGP